MTVRSAQRWESEGLPVYRKGSGKGARVYAYSDEIERWMSTGAWRAALAEDSDDIAAAAEQDGEVQPGAGQEPVRSVARLRLILIAGAAVLLCVAAVGWIMGLYPGGRVPFAWQLEGNRLRIIDEKDRLCWETRLEPLWPGYLTDTNDKTVISDIDGDGKTEVLVNFVPEKLGPSASSLLCFEQDGRLRWRVRYGAPKRFGSRVFEPVYNGRFVRPVRIGSRRLILTVANHFIWYPAQAALLDPASGRVVEEYWHPGAVYQIALHDLDADGTEEALLGAINNPGDGLGHAGLAVLKLPFSKAAPQTGAPEMAVQAVTGGGEHAYAIFPLSDVDRVMGRLPQMIHLSMDSDNRRIRLEIATTEGGVVYYLDYRLRPLEHRFSDGFAAIHERLFRQKLLDHRLTPAEMSELGKVIALPTAPDGNSPEVNNLWKY